MCGIVALNQNIKHFRYSTLYMLDCFNYVAQIDKDHVMFIGLFTFNIYAKLRSKYRH